MAYTAPDAATLRSILADKVAATVTREERARESLVKFLENGFTLDNRQTEDLRGAQARHSVYATALAFFEGGTALDVAYDGLVAWNLSAVLGYSGDGPDRERKALEHIEHLALMRDILGRRF